MPRPHRSPPLQALLVALLLAWGQPGHAQLSDNGTRISTSKYAIDLHQGTVFAGSRVTGMAGAYVAIAEDVDGNLQNPATPAVRPYYSVDHFDYFLGLGLTFPGSLSNLDFFNSGTDSTQLNNETTSFVFLVPAMNLQWGAFGLGVTAELQNYELAPALRAEGSALDAFIATTHLQLAFATFEGQLTFGYGMRLLTMSILEGASNATGRRVFGSNGVGVEVGLLWRPNDQPYRLGMALRSRIETAVEANNAIEANEDGDFVVGTPPNQTYLPLTAVLPYDFNIGFAYQFGRPLNPRWIDPSIEIRRYKKGMQEREHQRELHYERRLAEGADERALHREFSLEHEMDMRDYERFRQDTRAALKARYRAMPRRYLLVSGAVVISGPVGNAVGVESFLAQTVNRSGMNTTYSPRLGLESEVWPHRLKLRVGSYYEPTRFTTSSARGHFTAGVDLKLFAWSVFGIWPDDYTWRASAALDVSQRYLVWSVSLGGWY